MKTRKQAMILGAVLGLALVLTLNGCHPAISKSVSKEAERNLSFAEIRENPDQYRGKVVVLGGTILTMNKRQEETVVEVRQMRLGGTLEPREGDKTGGRFLAVFPGPLDPAEYTEGRRITVGGEIEGREWITVGEQEEGYPVIRAMDSRLWDSCGDGHYAYTFYRDYAGGVKSPYHKAHYYNYRCR